MKSKKIWVLISQSVGNLSKDNVSMLSAALAYYTFLSIAPLLVIIIVIAGFFFDKTIIQNLVVSKLSGIVTEEGAGGISAVLGKFMNPRARYMATAIGVISLFAGASAVFLSLQGALNIIWKTHINNGNSTWKFFKKRFISLGIVLILVILFMFLFFISTVSNIIIAFTLSLIPGMHYLLNLLNVFLFLVIFALIFASVYKFLPDIKVRWNDVWPGAALASVLFNTGRVIIGIYLVKSGLRSIYGAAGSVVVLLVWIYYTSYIFFFGAEFTKAYSVLYGSKKSG